jgi:hypothetical protein
MYTLGCEVALTLAVYSSCFPGKCGHWLGHSLGHPGLCRALGSILLCHCFSGSPVTDTAAQQYMCFGFPPASSIII